MGLLLFFISIILTTIAFVISIIFTPIYYLISLKWKTGIKALNSYFYTLAVSIDQFGNGATKLVLNRILIKRSSRNNSATEKELLPLSIYGESFHEFGDIDLTVSYVIAVNKYLGNLTLFGRFIEKVLHLIDTNHSEKALENQYKKDKEAKERSKKPLFYYNR